MRKLFALLEHYQPEISKRKILFKPPVALSLPSLEGKGELLFIIVSNKLENANYLIQYLYNDAVSETRFITNK